MQCCCWSLATYELMNWQNRWLELVLGGPVSWLWCGVASMWDPTTYVVLSEKSAYPIQEQKCLTVCLETTWRWWQCCQTTFTCYKNEELKKELCQQSTMWSWSRAEQRTEMRKLSLQQQGKSFLHYAWDLLSMPCSRARSQVWPGPMTCDLPVWPGAPDLLTHE